MRLCEFEKDGVRLARTEATAYIVTIRPAARWRDDDDESKRAEYAGVVQLLHLPLAGGSQEIKLLYWDETEEILSWLGAYLRRLDDGWVPPHDSLPKPRIDDVEPEFEDQDLGRAEREVRNDAQRLMAMHAPGEDDEEVAMDDLCGRRELDIAHDWQASRLNWPVQSDEELRTAAGYIDAQKKLAGDAVAASAVPDVDISLLAGPQRDLFTAIVGHAFDTLSGDEPPQLCVNVDGTAGTGTSRA
jgi:hypothetical protein